MSADNGIRLVLDQGTFYAIDVQGEGVWDDAIAIADIVRGNEDCGPAEQAGARWQDLAENLGQDPLVALAKAHLRGMRTDEDGYRDYEYGAQYGKKVWEAITAAVTAPTMT